MYKYTIEKEAEAPNFPIKAKVVLPAPSSKNPAGMAAIPDSNNELDREEHNLDLVFRLVMGQLIHVHGKFTHESNF